MQLGTQKAGDILEISEEDRNTHMHVIGGIGRGKSRFLFSMMKQDIIKNRGLCLLDPHGELYDQLVSWLSINKLLVKRRKIHLIDLADTEHYFGFNPLKVNSKDEISVAIDSASSGISHVWGGGDLTQTPLIKDTLERVLYVLADNNLTLAEARYLIYYEHYEMREKLISNLTDKEYAIAWASSHNKDKRRFDEEFAPIQRRFRSFLTSPIMKNIIGQKDSVIDFQKVMDNGEIVLVNLSPSFKARYEDARILGTLLVNEMYLSSRRREANKSRRFYLYIDEVHEFISDRIQEILINCRKYDLSFIGAHQFFEQLKSQGDLVYQGIKSSTGIKVAFGQLSADDSHEIAREIFMGKYDPHRINPATLKPVVVGHEVIELNSGSESEGETDTHTDSEGEAEANSEGIGRGSGKGSNKNVGAGVSQNLLVIDDGLEPSLLVSEGMQDSETSGTSEYENSSFNSTFSKINSRARTIAQGKSKTKTRGYSETLKPIIEERGNPYSLQEQEKMFADAIGTQNPRIATVRTPEGQVGQFKTLDVYDAVTTPKIKKKTVDKLVEESTLIESRENVEKQIEQRQKQLEKNPEVRDLKDEDFLS